MSNNSGNSGSHEKSFLSKLSKLANTQQSIQTLSLWVIYHQKKVKQTVQVWKKELLRAPPERQLVFLYLANDVMQNSRKKTLDFIREFGDCMHDALQAVMRDAGESEKKAVHRLLTVWEERKLFSTSFIQSIKKSMSNSGGSIGASGSSLSMKDTPLLKALQTVEKLETENQERKDKLTEKDIQDINNVENKITSSDQIIENMTLEELGSLQSEYAQMLNNLSQVRKPLELEYERRVDLIKLLNESLETQENTVKNLEEEIQERSKKIKVIQSFLTKIECKVNIKKIEDEFMNTIAETSNTNTPSTISVGNSSGNIQSTSAPKLTPQKRKPDFINDDYEYDPTANNGFNFVPHTPPHTTDSDMELSDNDDGRMVKKQRSSRSNDVHDMMDSFLNTGDNNNIHNMYAPHQTQQLGPPPTPVELLSISPPPPTPDLHSILSALSEPTNNDLLLNNNSSNNNNNNNNNNINMHPQHMMQQPPQQPQHLAQPPFMHQLPPVNNNIPLQHYNMQPPQQHMQQQGRHQQPVLPPF